MPQSRTQEVAFTIMMVCLMVYGMICYNIAIATGSLTNAAFLSAFHEFAFMAPIAFVLDLFVVSPRAGRLAPRICGEHPQTPFATIAAISAISVQLMCPLMSLAATLVIKRPLATELVPTWLQTVAINFPMALLWQFFLAGPVVRSAFGAIMSIRRGAQRA